MSSVAYGTAFPSSRPKFFHPFTPSQLFGASDTGDWWDASDLTTLFQDSAGSTPVTATGQSVGRFVGKKNGTALTQTTSSAKPVITGSGSSWKLTFDGVDDALQGLYTQSQPTIDVMAVQAASWLSSGTLWDGAANSCRLAQWQTTPNLLMYAGTTNLQSTAMSVGADHVVTCQWNGTSSGIAIDNGSYVTGDAGTNAPGGLTLGSYGGFSSGNYSNIYFYGGVRIGRTLTNSEIALCRTYFGRKAGLIL